MGHKMRWVFEMRRWVGIFPAEEHHPRWQKRHESQRTPCGHSSHDLKRPYGGSSADAISDKYKNMRSLWGLYQSFIEYKSLTLYN